MTHSKDSKDNQDQQEEFDAGFPFGKTTIKEIIRLCGLNAKEPMSEVFEFYTPEYAEKAIQAHYNTKFEKALGKTQSHQGTHGLLGVRIGCSECLRQEAKRRWTSGK